MGERQFIPLPDAVKDRVDFVAMPMTVIGYFKAIPWTEIAAALACLYTALRIAELVVRWWKRRK